MQVEVSRYKFKMTGEGQLFYYLHLWLYKFDIDVVCQIWHTEHMTQKPEKPLR